MIVCVRGFLYFVSSSWWLSEMIPRDGDDDLCRNDVMLQVRQRQQLNYRQTATNFNQILRRTIHTSSSLLISRSAASEL